MKEVDRLTPADLRQDPVWRFTGEDSPSETMVRPVKRLPAKSLDGAVVGVEVVFANGHRRLAILGNIDVTNPRLTKHFVTLSVFDDDGAIFHLARYHDVDAERRGPAQLARFLKMKGKDVFPIAWDVSRFARGVPAALSGVIAAEPPERLTRAQVIALAAP
jgi:hypothetical protein